jgi:two-component system, NarL family, sensor kinase
VSYRTQPETDTEKLRRRNRELSILNTIAAALNQEVDLARALNTTLIHVADLFGLQTGWVFLIDHRDKAYLAAAQNLPPALADHPRRMGGTCTCLDDYRAGQLEDPHNITCSRLENLVVGTAGLRFHASIPLEAHGKALGVLNVASTDWEELAEDDLELLYTVGDLVSIAVERARLFNQSVEFGAVEERNRLAREIHDTLAQGLTAIALKLETADALLESNGDIERIRDNVQQALAATRANLEEARRSVLDLRAAPLEGKTLAEALAELAAEAARKGRIDVRFDQIDASHPLPRRIEIAIYRIVQEALTNVRRHAHAQQVHVQMIVLPERIELAVTDDGCGFDPTTITEGHYGLIGINERVRLLAGRVVVISSPGEGTQLEVSIPLEPRHA